MLMNIHFLSIEYWLLWANELGGVIQFDSKLLDFP